MGGNGNQTSIIQEQKPAIIGTLFSEVTTSLIKYMSGLNPCNGFSMFDPLKIETFAEMYPDDFTTQEIGILLVLLRHFVTL
ncbi:hypothetical protein HanRHA438_Chr13g0628251 [Helianthus annuus]|nr:hypothetical protein HanRHA438_Chr13g0628251 [Helianthus annuus]